MTGWPGLCSRSTIESAHRSTAATSTRRSRKHNRKNSAMSLSDAIGMRKRVPMRRKWTILCLLLGWIFAQNTRLVVSDDEGALALGVALLDDFPVPREAQAIAARGAQAMVDGEQRLDVPGDLDAGGDEDDEVVTDALEVCDEMRGEHDAHAVLDGNAHESPQELAPSQRVEARHGFVEDQQLGPLGDPQRECELSPLP